MRKSRTVHPSIRWALFLLGILLMGLVLSSSAQAQTTLSFSVTVGNPATSYPAYPYTGISEYFSTVSTIVVTCSNGSADIRYTTDGTAPTTASAAIANNGTLVLARKFTLWAKAFVGGIEVASTQENYHATGMIAAGADHALALPSVGNKVWAWGENAGRQIGYYGQTTDATTKLAVTDSAGGVLTGVKAVAAGTVHSLALLNDGTVRAWGTITDGQLGCNSAVATYLPTENYIVKVRDGTGVSGTALSNVVEIAAGAYHSLAVTTNATATGKVWAWGRGASGQIGNGAGTTDRLYPVAVLNSSSAPLVGIEQVAAGLSHSAALSSAREVYTWGLNSNGQVLGTTATTTPVTLATKVTGFATAGNPAEANAITCGDSFTLVIRSSDLTVWGWGANAYGQLGNNATTATQRTPVQVVKLSDGLPLTNVIAVEAGQYHSLALKSDGTVWSWGDNALGKLGDGTVTDHHAAIPVAISGYVVAIAAGGDFSMALTDDGKIYSWGNPASGRLGDGTTTGAHYTPATSTTYAPILVNRAPVNILYLSSTGPFTQPGAFTLIAGPGDADGNISRVDFYQGASFLGSVGAVPWQWPLSNLSAGNYSFTAVAVDTGAATATATTSVTVGAPTVSLTTPVTSTSESTPGTPGKFRVTVSPVQNWPFTIYYTMSGTAENGADYTSLPGSVVIPTGSASVDVNLVPSADRLVETTENAVMTIAPNSTYTIGSSNQGSVSIADNPPVAAPIIYPDPSTKTKVKLVQVSCPTSGATICYTTDGTDPGPTSNPTTGTFRVKVATGTTLKVKAFKSGSPDSDQAGGTYGGKAIAAAGYDNSFALLSDGTAWAWGNNSTGRLGLGTSTTSYNLPQRLAALDNARGISPSSTYTAAVLSDGTFAAFGSFSSSLGNGTTTSSSTPVSVSGLTGAMATSAGKYHLAVLKSDGTVWTWGINAHGQLGNGTTGSSTTPVQVMKSAGVPFDHVTGIAVGDDFTAFLTDDGNVWVCGYYVRLGTTATTDSLYPTQVTALSNMADISSGWLGVRAIKMDGTVLQWGELAGAPVTTYNPGNITGMSSGDNYSALLDGTGTIYTYGQGGYGQLGNGLYGSVNFATAIYMPLLVTQVSAGFHHGLAIQDDGREAIFWSWGRGYDGQLGLGGNTVQNVPWPVSFTYPQSTVDTNGDGYNDWDDIRMGLSPVDLDLDHDGISNADEILHGTSPFSRDTDGDGHPDNEDAFPLDPTRWLAPTVDPDDHTPPVITLVKPLGAVLQ